MTDTPPAQEATLFPKTAGERLREAREAQGLSLTEIAARTRVPVRQLEAIEASNYAALPSITYSVGFAKAYARVVGLDEVAIARDVRGANEAPSARRVDYEAYEIDEPSRVPSRGLAFGAMIVAVLLLIGVGLWYGTNLFRGDGEPAPAPTDVAQNAVPQAEPTVAAPAAATGTVTLTATDAVWLRVYDNTGKTLFQGTLNAGDKYDVPADAAGPMINVGRADKLQVTVGSTPVAPLGDGKLAIKDVAVSAAALTARGSAAPAPVAAPAATETGPRPRPTRAAPVRERRDSAPAAASAPLNIAAPVVRPEPTPSAAPTPAP